MSRELILDLVMPHKVELVKCTLDGYQEHMDLPQGYRAKIGPGARGHAVHDLICCHLEEAFGCDGETIGVVERNQLRYLQIRGDEISVGLCPKKLDDRLKICKAHTQQQQALRTFGTFQGLLAPWADPDVFYAILGYRLSHDLVAPHIAEVYLTQEDADGLLWSCCLWSEADSASDVVKTASSPTPVVTAKLGRLPGIRQKG